MYLTIVVAMLKQERNLTAVESPEAVARRAFRKFDKEGIQMPRVKTVCDVMAFFYQEMTSYQQII